MANTLFSSDNINYNSGMTVGKTFLKSIDPNNKITPVLDGLDFILKVF